MGIKLLPSAVVASLRTDVTVTTTAQCVTELVLNSVDARASSIAIRVDLKNYKIQVIDNGCGLSSSDLGLVGTRYMTSKCRSLQDLQSNLGHFGFRGEALSSIAEVCGTMTISSRSRSSDETFCKVFTRGTAHNVSKSRQPRASCGTTITVADFLFNRPVRRARIKPALDLEEIKSHIESVALINPTISFSLRNDENGEIILQTKRTEDIPSTFGILFGVSIASNLVAVEESMGPFKVEGYISNEAHPLKNLQFIYINKRLLLKTKIHKLVNSLLARSAILKSNNVPYAPISKEINHSVFLAFSPPKRDKHAVFVLNILCPLSEYDITLDPKKTLVEFCDWDRLLSCFENLLRKFIERESDQSFGKANCFDSEPPRKIKSVIDEVNLLAREDAMGADLSETSEESITTKNLHRAIHGLPANRRQVNLSPVPSTECFTSTSSSGILSCVADEKHSVHAPSDLGSILTEKPYAPLTHRSTLQHEEKKFPMKQPTGWTETECSETSRYSVDSLKCLFKRPEFPARAKPDKGFIQQPIYFQEKFRNVPNKLQENNSKHLEEASASPLNALTNIKEIRRRKLLSNLNKFSFNVTCDKPVLHKTELPAHHVLETAAQPVVDLQKKNDLHSISLNKLPAINLKESRAVQTIFSSADFEPEEGTEKGTSLVGFAGSCAGASSIRSENKNNSIVTDSYEDYGNFDINRGAFSNFDDVLKCSDTNLLKQSENQKNMNCKIASFPVVNWSSRPKISNKHTNFPLAHDNIQTGMQKIPQYSTHDKILHNTCVTGGPKSTSKISSESSIFQMSDSKFIYEDIPVDLEDVLPPRNNALALKVSSTADLTIKPSGLNIYNEAVPFDLDANPGQQVLSKKLVDYDSSPCSSQEISCSVENQVQIDVVSPSILKRKLEEQDELLFKKFCTSPENHTTDKPSVLEDDIGSQEIFKLVTNESAFTEDSRPEETILTNFDSVRSLKETLSAEQSSIHSSDKEMDKVLIGPEPVPNLHISDNDCLRTKNHQAKIGVLEDTLSSDTLNKQQEWIEQLDHNGRPFYFHKESGLTSYQMPKEESQAVFKIGDRFSFLPKGMSPILYDKTTNEPSNSPSITSFRVDEDLSIVKWSSDGSNNPEKKADFWPLVDQLLSAADNYSTKIHEESQVSNATLQELSKTDIKVYNVMFPYSFTKDLFSNLRVLGQLDKKFIVTIATIETKKDVIVLFDQHAVHERIRVENLTQDYKCLDGLAKWKSAPVDPALPLQLSSIEVRILESYQEKMENLGFHFCVVDSTTISVLRVPTCLLLRENREVTGRGVSVLRQHLESLIREQVDSLLNTRGVGTDHPTIIRNVISSEACRGAVKFGHSLTVADCQAFLHNLSLCDLPFQCAHGRPALMPVVDLSMLKPKPQTQKLNLKKLKKQFL